MLKLEATIKRETTTYQFGKTEAAMIGAQETNNIVVPAPFDVAIHSRISWTGDEYLISVAQADCVLINGDYHTELGLCEGDIIEIGPLKLKVLECERKKAREDKQDEEDWGDPYEDNASAKKGKKSKKRKSKSPTKKRLSERQSREPSVLKSPLIGSLFLLMGLLGLIALSLFFLLGRQSAEVAFQTANQHFQEQKYRQAATLYEEYLNLYPGDQKNDLARLEWGQARLYQEIRGGQQRWREGLTALDGLIDEQRANETFQEQKPMFANYAEEIALGAAKTARKTGQRELLDVIDDASRLWSRLTPEEERTPEAIEKFQALLRDSEIAVVRKEVSTGIMQQIQEAIDSKQTKEGFERWRELITRYPELKSDLPVAKALNTICEIELAAIETLSSDQLPKPQEFPAQQFTLLSKTLTNEAVVSATKGPVLSQTSDTSVSCLETLDCIFGLEQGKGTPIWRVQTGRNRPFSPIVVDRRRGTSLIPTTNPAGLLCLNKDSGEAKWFLPTPSVLAPEPSIEGTIARILCRTGEMYQVDMNTGEVVNGLRYPRVCSTGPVINSNSEIVVVADSDVLYRTTPGESDSQHTLSYIGHPSESVSVPAITMGQSTLLAINQASTAQLVVLKKSDWELKTYAPELWSVKLQHRVIDPLFLRGRFLFAPQQSGEMALFNASDDPQNNPLQRVTSVEFPASDFGVSSFAGFGSDEIWIGSSGLQSFQVSGETLVPVNRLLLTDRFHQALQPSSLGVFAGLSNPSRQMAKGIDFRREDYSLRWQTLLPEQFDLHSLDQQNILACAPTGQLWSFPSQQIENNSQLTRMQELPAIDYQTSYAKANGKLWAWNNQEQGQVWELNAAGRIQATWNRSVPLLEPPMTFDNKVFIVHTQGIEELTNSVPKFPPFSLNQTDQSQTIAQAVPTPMGIAVLTNEGNLLHVSQQVDNSLLFWDRMAELKIEHPMAGRMTATQESLVFADRQKNLVQLAQSTLRIKKKLELKQKLIFGVANLNNNLLLQTADFALSAFVDQPALTEAWTIPLKAKIVSLWSVDESHLAVVLKNGNVALIDPSAGNIVKTGQLQGTPCGAGVSSGELILVPTTRSAVEVVQWNE